MENINLQAEIRTRTISRVTLPEAFRSIPF